MLQGDCREYMKIIPDNFFDLILTSPPFALVRKKDYGNVDEDEYTEWFKTFAEFFYRILKPNGSLIIDIGTAWRKGKPVKSLYPYEVLLMLCKDLKFYLAQELFWYNPCKLPTPCLYVSVERIRIKDSISMILWLSKIPHPKANNKALLCSYSKDMKQEFRKPRSSFRRPSGHKLVPSKFKNNGGSIPPNLIAVPNASSNDYYLRRCKANSAKIHPARFPEMLPEFFIRFLTDEGDIVLDPFSGSATTGAVAERLKRNWLCIEEDKTYFESAKLRFPIEYPKKKEPVHYKIPSPMCFWSNS